VGLRMQEPPLLERGQDVTGRVLARPPRKNHTNSRGP
jgi:hypothetical protein